MLTHVDLFSGIGGFALAAEWAGFKTIVFCEKDEYCQRVLRKHWPGVPIISEIRNFKWPMADADSQRRQQKPRSTHEDESKNEGRPKENNNFPSSNGQITLITGGFPCQPFSVAGKRRGKEDDRFLWPEMFAVISEVRPTWVLAENVAGIVKMELDNCLSDLESEGYETEAFIIPACAVEAKHRRDRVWIMAHDKRHRWDSQAQQELDGETNQGEQRRRPDHSSQDVADRQSRGLEIGFAKKAVQLNAQCGCMSGRENSEAWWDPEPDVGRVAHGVPSRVDRLKSLGNAIVPQVAYEIIRAIRMIEEDK